MKLVIFTLVGKEYGIEISQVKEVIRPRKITTIPEAAGFVEGVISLRGKVVPLINLRNKFGLESGHLSESNRIVICSACGNSIGLIVDSIVDVSNIEDVFINPADEVLKNARYLTGIVNSKRGLILIMDIKALLSNEESDNIGKVFEKVEVKKRK